MSHKRKIELSLLNVLFCLTVIFIHIISYAVSAFSPMTAKYNLAMIPWRLSAYVVQGFIFLSGVKLFLNSKDDLTYKDYLKGRIKGVILPYAVCFLVYYILFIICFGYPLDIGLFIKRFLLGDLSCHLYFIPLLLQFDLLFPVWKKIIGKCSPIVIIPLSLIISWVFEYYFPAMLESVCPGINYLYNDRTFTTYLIYWIIGCYIGKNYTVFSEFIKKKFCVMATIHAVIAAIMVYFTFMGFNGLLYVPYLNCIHNLYVLSAIIFLFAGALNIPQNFASRIPLLLKIDKASFYIYLYHMLTLLVINGILSRAGILSQFPAFVIRMIFTYSVTIFLSVLYTGYVKGIKRKQENIHL